METIDDETSDAAVEYITRQAKANQPFFCWFNSTRMHAFTHVKAEHRDKPGFTSRTEYNDGMIEHDAVVGKILKALDDAGIADNTIVLYTTDNGPHKTVGPTAASRRSATRRPPTGKAPSAYRAQTAGRDTSSPVRSLTRSSAVTTGSRHSSPRPEMPM